MGHIHTHDRGVRYHFIIFSTILVLGMLASLMLGAVNISIPDIFRALFLDPENKYHLIIRDARLPRTILAVLVGMCLSVAGAIMQGITRNPMASPLQTARLWSLSLCSFLSPLPFVPFQSQRL